MKFVRKIEVVDAEQYLHGETSPFNLVNGCFGTHGHLGDNREDKVNHTDWVVKKEDGVVVVMSNFDFEREFEKMDKAG